MRLRRATRARLSAAADSLGGSSVDETVSRALDLLERELFWQRVDEAHARRTPQEAAEDAAELDPWDRASSADAAEGQLRGR